MGESDFRKSTRKIVVVDNFDHIPGVNEASIGGRIVKITGDRLSMTGWKLPPRLRPKHSLPVESEEVDDDGISRFVPKGTRYFISSEDIKNLEKADALQANKTNNASGPGKPKPNQYDAQANVFVSNNSIWTMDPDEPILEESSYQYDKTRKLFLGVFILSCSVSVFLLLLTYYWTFTYADGIISDATIKNETLKSQDQIKKYFNIHVLITITFVFTLQGSNSLIYRIFPHVTKFKVKCFHAGIAFIGAIGHGLGIFFALYAKQLSTNEQSLSLHGCIGYFTMAFYELQFITGFSVFMLPYASFNLRVQFIPIHKFLGGMAFLCTVTTVVTGIVVLSRIIIPLDLHALLTPISIIINIVGLLTVIFAMLTTFLVTDHHFRRRPRPELRLAKEEEIRNDDVQEVEMEITDLDIPIEIGTQT